VLLSGLPVMHESHLRLVGPLRPRSQCNVEPGSSHRCFMRDLHAKSWMLSQIRREPWGRRQDHGGADQNHLRVTFQALL
jgi:hypothetical protein